MLGRLLAAALVAGIAVGVGCGLPGASSGGSGFGGSGGMTSSRTSSRGASGGGSGTGISIGSTGAAGGGSNTSASSAGGSGGASTSNTSSGSGTGGATPCYEDTSVVCCPQNAGDTTGGCTPAGCVYDGSGQFCCKDGGNPCSLNPSHNFKCDDTSMCSSQSKLCCVAYMFDMMTMKVKYTGDASCQDDCGNPTSGAELCNTNAPHCSAGQCCPSQSLGHGLGYCASMCF